MPIKEINRNGKSKVISHKTGVLSTPNHGQSDKAGSSAPSHSKRPIVDHGHSKNPTN